MKKTLSIIAAMTMLVACNGAKKGDTSSTDNPLMKPSNLLMQAPEFDKIQLKDYLPAFKEAMRQQSIAIDSIVNNPQPATFENTFIPYEKSGATLDRVSAIFFGISGADGTDSIRQIEEEVSPLLSAHQDSIMLNAKLFGRIKYVYDHQLDSLKGEDRRLVEIVYRDFVMNGALLDAEKKKQLSDINLQLSKLTNNVSNKITDGTNAAAVLVDSISQLSGLSQAAIDKAAQLAQNAGHKGKYLLTITNTTQQPYLANLNDRALREKVLKSSMTRCERGDKNDTRADIRKIMELRLQKANLLGFDCYANWVLQNQMAGNAQRVMDLLKGIIPVYTKKAHEVANTLQNFARKTAGKDFKLQAWDWEYYAQKYKKAKYDIDDNQVKQYFLLDSVLQNGIFYAANKLYGLTFKPMPNLPVYDKDVHAYEVFDKDGKPLALFYTDYFHRNTKNGGAWMSNFVNQSKLLGTMPVVYNICNFTKPVAGQPALISFDDVTTMFHEFGHALHGMFASQKYLTLSGTNVPRDFVEMPSQFNEHWATDPDVMQHYARNWKTGEPIPQTLVAKLKEAHKFDQAYSLGENIGAVAIDMAWHMIKKLPIPKVEAFETNSLEAIGLNNPQIPPRYLSNYFRHMLCGGYSAGYYSYIWTEVLDDNIYDWFMKHGGMTRENGQHFRDVILSQGNSQDLNKIFTEMTGLQKPNTDALLRSRGLK